MSWLLRSLLKHTTARVCSRSIGVALWTREDTLLTTAERHFEMLSLRLAMSRPFCSVRSSVVGASSVAEMSSSPPWPLSAAFCRPREPERANR